MPGACAEIGGRCRYKFTGFSCGVDLMLVGVIKSHASIKLIVLHSIMNSGVHGGF
jgi:hypothetical protein